MQLFQLFERITRPLKKTGVVEPAHMLLYTIDLGGIGLADQNGHIEGCIAVITHQRLLNPPSNKSGIRLADCLMFHGPFTNCGEPINYSRQYNDLRCSGCPKIWSLPPEATTLGQLIEWLGSKGAICKEASEKVVFNGPA